MKIKPLGIALLIFWMISFCYLFAYRVASDSLLLPGDGVLSLDFLTTLEKEVIRELNLARTNPSKYAEFIEDFKRHYAGKYIYLPGQTQIATNEGVDAVNEAIRFLRNCTPLPLLRVSKGLSLAARDHVNDQGPVGLTGHNGKDNSTPETRISRFGTWGVAYAENIEYGNFAAREIVMQLIIDDGVSNRGHRANIFKSNFTLIGVNCGPHNSYGQMCVMDFAGSYREKKL